MYRKTAACRSFSYQSSCGLDRATGDTQRAMAPNESGVSELDDLGAGPALQGP